FHQTVRANALTANEHALGVKMARHHATEWRKDDVLLAINRAARNDDRIARIVDQKLRDGEAISEDRKTLFGQVMHHLKRRGAAVDDHRLAIIAHSSRDPGNGALLRNID